MSVIMGVFNGAKTLETAIASIEAQSYESWELVICDDASTDATAQILAEVRDRLGPARCTTLSNRTNLGLAASLNRCLAASRGTLIARMDADDMSVGNRLQVQVDFLLEHPDIGLVGTAMQRFDDEGLNVILLPPELLVDRHFFEKHHGVPFAHATVVVRKEVLAKAGNYSVSWRTRRAEDLDLWFKVLGLGVVGANLEDPLYLVREDHDAVRRRTFASRVGGYVTRIRGLRRLGCGPLPYIHATVALVIKTLLPYRILDAHRAWQKRRWLSSQDG